MISFRKVLKHNFWKVASLNDGSNTEKYIDYYQIFLYYYMHYSIKVLTTFELYIIIKN